MKYFITVLFILFAAFLSLNFSTTELLAPELFSYGRGYGIATSKFEIYLIHVRWENPDHDFLFLMAGKRDGNTMRGVIMQLFGERIETYAPYDCSRRVIYCYGREIKTNWRGWIEFRGHRRPICGGEKIKEICVKTGD